jgi:VacB/RNase II family 3'-5' exoribonuclease
VPANGHQQHREILQSIAQQAMLERGLLPNFSAAVSAELRSVQAFAVASRDPDGDASGIRDLTDLGWASIDNDDSRDLDQLTVAEAIAGGAVRICVAIADVDSLVKADSAIDAHARHNTTSVYTAAEIFPMLPEQLSTDLTSLNAGEERLAVVVDMVIGADRAVQSSEIYRARVRNHAKLAYNSVASWLEGSGAPPQAMTAVAGLAENLRLQDRVAQGLRALRHINGALGLETIQAKPLFEGDQLHDLAVEKTNRAKQIIEDFMIAANGVTARYLAAKQFPSIRRVVRTPKRWDRIVALALEHGFKLPDDPDSTALDEFLVTQRAADPLRFADLSLAVVKLLGAGEYVAERPDHAAPGHFGLAVKDYAHSTAPNRRYPDLLTQRLLKAAMTGREAPYSFADQDVLAKHFTEGEDAANKVERQVAKSAAAMLLESRIGEEFAALVTGASAKGTWARLLVNPVEGRVVRGFEWDDVGDQIRVRLMSVNVERGFIDFARVDSAGSARHSMGVVS